MHNTEKAKDKSERADFIQVYVAPILWTGLLMGGLFLFITAPVLLILIISRLIGFNPDGAAVVLMLAGVIGAFFVPALLWQLYSMVREGYRRTAAALRFYGEHRRIAKLKVHQEM